ncbi:uncharacterized protein K441DRAFT_670809 [Cenococcum geophilum 1.58]|uniref:uncharacterized protein n=1 Tax=Cenococcum geophilum 1.58 TaxID=794803 RepID=UPI000DC8D98F|nr:hypothetical protein K441DRAFT_670809 [Cenococcum geophilum 1.58]
MLHQAPQMSPNPLVPAKPRLYLLLLLPLLPIIPVLLIIQFATAGSGENNVGKILTGFELCLAVFALIAWITVRRARRNFVAKTENEGGEGSRGLISLRQGNSVVQTQLTGGMGTT